MATGGRATPSVAWAGADLLYLTAWGSTGCPTLPVAIVRTATQQIDIRTKTFPWPGSNACAADLRPDTSTIKLPAGINASQAVTVTIDGTTPQTLPRR
jgi:hypothetical protein